MKKLLLLLFSLFTAHCFAQPQELNLLGTWNDNSLPATSFFDNTYNEIWGLAVNDSEIAVIGSTMGTHFIDVTDPTNPIELTNAYVPGAAQGTSIVHRDYHDYKGYMYVVCDENDFNGSQKSTLQIIDISNLPDTAVVVYDSNDILERAHNVFIDSVHAKMYMCGVRKANGGGAVHLQVLDISDPINPILLNDYNGVPYVHDIYVEDNIAYINCGNPGFFVVDFTDAATPVVLGSMTTYPQQGYNHSGWLDTSGDYYYLADETWDTDLKVVDVSNFDDMSVDTTFNAEQTLTTIPHNLIVRCNLLYVSYYYEGVQIFDISNPTSPQRTHFYDTSTRTNMFGGYEGAWGIYPFLPSGNILASDMQNGLFVFEAISDHACENAVSTITPESSIQNIKIFPQPASSELTIEIKSIENQFKTNFELIDIMGKTTQTFEQQDLTLGKNKISLQLNNKTASGIYFLKISTNDKNVIQKVIIAK